MNQQTIAELHQMDDCNLSYEIEELFEKGQFGWAAFWVRQRPDVLHLCGPGFGEILAIKHREEMEGTLLGLGFTPEQAAYSAGEIVTHG